MATRHSNTLHAFNACSLPEDYILPILFTSVLISNSFVSFNNHTSSLLFRKFRNIFLKKIFYLVLMLSACYNTKFYKSALCDVTGQWHALSLWSSCGASRPADHRIPKKDHVKDRNSIVQHQSVLSRFVWPSKVTQTCFGIGQGSQPHSKAPGSANEREGAFGRFWPACSLDVQTKTETI